MSVLNYLLMRKRPLTRSKQKSNLYKLVVARSDIHASFNACKVFLDKVDNINHDLYYPLYAAIIICYARPFSDNKPIGPLPKEWRGFSDRRLQLTHNDIISARNELIAHSDPKVRKAEIIPSGVILGGTTPKTVGIGVQVRTRYFPLERFKDIHDMVLDLGRRLEATIEQQIEKIYGGMELPNAPFELRFDEGL